MWQDARNPIEEMTKLSDSIIGKIKCEQIKPVPKWHFLMKRCTFWTMFVISVILGSLSFSVIVHFLNSGDISVASHFQGSWITSIVMLIPLFWLASLLFFAFLALLNWKCTKLGYCTRRRWIFLGSIVLSVALGEIFFELGMGRKMDNAMTVFSPFYDKYKHKVRRDIWLQPEKGLLTGKIIEVDEEMEKLLVQDEDGKIWIVDDKGIEWESESLESKGKIIKAVGKKVDDTEFKAIRIMRCTYCQDDEDFDDAKGVCQVSQSSDCKN